MPESNVTSLQFRLMARASSSRETAATMLEAFGIRCVIAPGFGQIFHDNCFRNGMLPLALGAPEVARLAEVAQAGGEWALDVAALTLRAPDGSVVPFELPRFRQQMLLDGRDEVDATLARQAAIEAWRRGVLDERPWELQPGAP